MKLGIKIALGVVIGLLLVAGGIALWFYLALRDFTF